METHLKGKNVLVTEVGSPFGRSTALAFAREGSNLVLGSLVDADSLGVVQQEAAALGINVVAGICDASSEDSVKQFVQRGLDEFTHIDILVNNMTWSAAKQSFAVMSFEAWQQAIQQGLTRSLFICRAVLPGMLERRWGRLLQCIGLEGFVGGDPATSAVQAGLSGLRAAWRPNTVNIASPQTASALAESTAWIIFPALTQCQDSTTLWRAAARGKKSARRRFTWRAKTPATLPVSATW